MKSNNWKYESTRTIGLAMALAVWLICTLFLYGCSDGCNCERVSYEKNELTNGWNRVSATDWMSSCDEMILTYDEGREVDGSKWYKKVVVECD